MSKKKIEEKIEAKPESTTELSQLEREWVDEIKKLEGECSESFHAAAVAKEHSKSANEEYAGCVSALRSTIRRGPNKQPELPGFDAADEAWRAVPICEALKLSEKQSDKLEAIGISSVGTFEFLRSGDNPAYPRGLLDVPGVGQATIDKWEDQIVDWLAARLPGV